MQTTAPSLLKKEDSCATYMLDSNGNIVACDNDAAKLKGYTTKEIIGLNFSVFFTKDEIVNGEPENNLKEAIAKGSVEKEGWRVKQDNSLFYAHTILTALFNATGELTGFVKRISDITNHLSLSPNEKKENAANKNLSANIINRLKEELILRSKELKNVFESITDAVISIDHNWCYTYANKQAGVLLNRDPDSLIGKIVWDLFPDVVGSATYDAMQQAMQTRRYTYSLDYYAPLDLWQENHVYPSANGIYVFIRDITLQKKAEAKLMESELKYRQIAEIANEGIWMIDEIGITTFVNQHLLKMLGYTHEEMIGKPLLDFMDDTAKRKMILNLERRKSGLQEKYEFECLTKSGSYLTILISSTPLIKEGKYAGALAMITDITEIKKNEQILVKEKELTESLINGLPGIFYMYDENGVFYRWNKNYEKITGYSAEEIANMHPVDFYDPNNKDLIRKRIKDVFSNNAGSSIEVLLVTKFKEQIPFMVNSWKVDVEGKYYLMGIGTDISEKQKTQELLSLSEANYKLLFDNNPMPMWMFTSDEWKIVGVNNAALDMYGYSKEEFLQKQLIEMRPAEDVQEFLDYSNDKRLDKKIRTHWRHQKKDGTIFHVELQSNEIIYNNQKVKLILVNDITQKMEAEARAEKSYNELKALASHLQLIREEERTGIAREIHDELGQQLTALKFALVLVKKYLNKDVVSADKEVDGALESINHIIASVRKIASDLRPAVVEDMGLIKALKWHSSEFEKRTSIKSSFDCKLISQGFDKTMSLTLYRVYQEALTNVARHSKATEVHGEMDSDGKFLTLSIADNGCGFDLETLKTSKSLGILGIKERAMMINGVFNIDSKINQGTIIKVKVAL